MSEQPTHPAMLPHDLGLKRTVMAADRTLMAWVRTSLSMVSFGFTIYKMLETLSEQEGLVPSESPQRVGLFLCGLGTLAIVLGTVGYWVNLRDLNRLEDFRIGRPVLIMALIMSMASIAFFALIATRSV